MIIDLSGDGVETILSPVPDTAITLRLIPD
jgi:hypothetical protein